MTPVDLARLGQLPGVGQPLPIKPPAGEGIGVGGAGGAPDGESPFGGILKDSIKQVNHLQHAAEKSIQDMAAGGATSLHDTMIALEKAETSFKLMMQVRNKIVDAYHEVLRMQV